MISLHGSPSSTGAARMLSVLRIVTGFLFIAHGTMKLFNYPPMPPGSPPIELMSQMGLAGVLETFGGAAVMLGLLTRPLAFLLAGEMAVAYFQVHFARGFLPAVNGGELAVLFCFIFLYLAFAGGGAWSLDAFIVGRRGELTSDAIVPARIVQAEPGSFRRPSRRRKGNAEVEGPR
jgi:putative oxidoreductase